MKSETLIILDWDDTLFPTSWMTSNRINLMDKNLHNKYIPHFTELDKILSRLLRVMLLCGKILIITNALPQWVHISCSIMPATYEILSKHIQIISARKDHQTEYPANMYKWKNLAFKKHVLDFYTDKNIHNIISIGDADYEYRALVDLYNIKHQASQRYLKAIKFIDNPTNDELKDQLNVICENFTNVQSVKKHLDLKFDKKSF